MAGLLSGAAAAQKTQYGVFAGAQYTSAHYLLRDKKQSTEGKPGAHAGVMLLIPFENRLVFTPSLYYSGKGYKVALTDTSSLPGIDAVANDVSLHSIELAPLFLIYMGKGTGRPFVQFGPTVDFNFYGRERVRLNTGRTVDRQMRFSNNDYGRITAALLVRLGYETKKGLVFGAHYSHGAGSLNNNDYGPIIKHRIFGVSIGKWLTHR
ncbi:porin family protein [Flaviaesturariibacter amylovorans]|uniref:Outer membrane protein beta-barrel domain-containing protein n=1 Tax=Flaviaesturariibacter amylovorans TaxID=1084520 RepID=A0ABP8H142_9BACT